MSIKDDFLEYEKNENENIWWFIRYPLKKVEEQISLEKLSDLSIDELVNIIIEAKPSSNKAVSNYLYAIGRFLKWTGNEEKAKELTKVENGIILKRSMEKYPIKKFISNKEFYELIKDIEFYEEYNPLFYSCLLRCIYEGIYCADLSILKNLRASDIHDDIVTLRDDNGKIHDLKISHELAEDLIDLSTITIWERRNKQAVCHFYIEGLYDDSCFKIEKRAKGDCFKSGFLKRSKDIMRKYLDYSIRPKNLFISGIVYRIKLELEKNGITLEHAFAYDRREDIIVKIISKELERCHYNITNPNFRAQIRGSEKIFER